MLTIMTKILMPDVDGDMHNDDDDYNLTTIIVMMMMMILIDNLDDDETDDDDSNCYILFSGMSVSNMLQFILCYNSYTMLQFLYYATIPILCYNSYTMLQSLLWYCGRVTLRRQCVYWLCQRGRLYIGAMSIGRLP